MTDKIPDIATVKFAATSTSGLVTPDEWNTWLKAHDSELIKNTALKPASPAEMIQVVWKGSYEVPPGQTVPKGVRFLYREEESGLVEMRVSNGIVVSMEGNPCRTLTPLPPLIPDDCQWVWASTTDDPERTVWRRHSTEGADPQWSSLDLDGKRTIYARDLVDPVPVQPESEARS